MNVFRTRRHTALLASILLLVATSSVFASPSGTAAGEYSSYALLDGARVHYLTGGSGDTAVVFVHGWACDSTFWRYQLPALTRSSRVIALDLPGHGWSDKPRVAYTQDHYARAIEAVMRQAGVRKAVLVGHSMGASVIRQFYRRYPEKTLALVVVDGALRLPATRAEMAKLYEPLRGPKFRELSKGAYESMLGTRMPQEVRSECLEKMLSTPQHVVVSTADGLLDNGVWAADPVRVPVLAVLAKSPAWKDDTEAFFRSLARDLDYRMWEDAGHFLMLERPREFNATLEAFLSRVTKRRGR